MKLRIKLALLPLWLTTGCAFLLPAREPVETFGLTNWLPKEDPSPDDYQQLLWLWLKNYSGPEIYLGFGDVDKFAKTNRILASRLPKENSTEIPGAHTRPTWRKLFEKWLDSGVN